MPTSNLTCPEPTRRAPGRSSSRGDSRSRWAPLLRAQYGEPALTCSLSPALALTLTLTLALTPTLTLALSDMPWLPGGHAPTSSPPPGVVSVGALAPAPHGGTSSSGPGATKPLQLLSLLLVQEVEQGGRPPWKKTKATTGPRTALGEMRPRPNQVPFASYNANGLKEGQWDLLQLCWRASGW